MEAMIPPILPVFVCESNDGGETFDASAQLEDMKILAHEDNEVTESSEKQSSPKKNKKRGRPVIKGRGQYHVYRSFKFVLVKDQSLMKIDSNVRQRNKDKFAKKHIKLEKRNADPDYLKATILDNFPELLNFADVFSLWQMRMNTPELVPLSDSINNAKALCNSNELKRSCVYIRPCVFNKHSSQMFATGDLNMLAKVVASAAQIPQTCSVSIKSKGTSPSNSELEASSINITQPSDHGAPLSTDMVQSLVPPGNQFMSLLFDSVISGNYNSQDDQSMSTSYNSATCMKSSASYTYNLIPQQSTDMQYLTRVAVASQASSLCQGSWTTVSSTRSTLRSTSHDNMTDVRLTSQVDTTDEFDIAICPQCRKFLFEPITLPCHDSFCLQCLENIEQSGAWNSSGPFCPECGGHFHASPSGLKSIAFNSFIERIVRIRRLENRDDFDRACETCSLSTTEGETVPDAVGYCVECQQKLCLHCSDIHKKIRSTMTHVIAPLGGSCGGVPGLMKANNSLHCCSTCNRPASRFCPTCIQLLCSECLHPHTNHELEQIADAVREYRNKLSKCYNELNRLMELNSRLEEGKASYTRAEQEIKRKAEDLKTVLDKHGLALLKQLDDIRETTTAKKEQCLLSAKSMSKASVVARELADKGSNCDLLQYSWSIVTFASPLLQDNVDEDVEQAVPRIRFQPSDAIGKLEGDFLVGCLLQL